MVDLYISQKKKPIVVAIASQKGGVAKTTTALSLGGALVQEHKQVLLIDLDPQANLTLSLGLNPNQLPTTIADVLFNGAQLGHPPANAPGETLASIRHVTSIAGLDLAPANGQLELAERYLPVRQRYETSLRKAVSSSNLPHDFILLDCPPSINAITLNALVAADLLVIPTQAEFFSAHALKIMMEAIRRVRSQYNPQLRFRILITIFDRRNRIHRELALQIQNTFRQATLETIIEVDTKLRESVLAGYPITHFKPQARSALQYGNLAHELITIATSSV